MATQTRGRHFAAFLREALLRAPSWSAIKRGCSSLGHQESSFRVSWRDFSGQIGSLCLLGTVMSWGVILSERWFIPREATRQASLPPARAVVEVGLAQEV